MWSSKSIGARWSVVVVPLFLFGCSSTNDGGGDESDDGASTGCQNNDDCRLGRACIDLDGNRDDHCDEGEECACGTPGAGGSAGDTNTGGGSGGATTGGATTGGNATGGATTGGNATGGATTGGNATGGATTGGNATGGAGRGGSATGGASGGSDCGAYCDRLVGAMCAAVTEAACLTDCNGLSTDCPAEAPAVRACVANPANTISCMAGSAVITGCNAPLDALDRCLVCVPETGDGTCVTCSKTTCCDEGGDYSLAPDATSFFNCANACTTQTCFDACVRSYPTAGNAFLALVDCQDTKCSEPCLCEVTTNDDACAACYKGSCCAETVDYSLAPDLAGFEDCVALCQDDICLNDCIDQFPQAGAAFGPWSDCIYASCFDACQ